MAGYMTRLNGYVYDGHHQAAAAIANGVFASLDANKKVAALSAAASGVVMTVVEKTTLFGLPAVRLEVLKNADGGVWFVENEWDVNEYSAYDESAYTAPAGAYVKMHQPVTGDQLIMSVDATTYAALAVGDSVSPASGGGIAKNS